MITLSRDGDNWLKIYDDVPSRALVLTPAEEHQLRAWLADHPNPEDPQDYDPEEADRVDLSELEQAFHVLRDKVAVLENDMLRPIPQEQLYGATSEDQRRHELEQKISILRRDMNALHQSRTSTIEALRSHSQELNRRVVNQDKEIAELRELINRIPKSITVRLDTTED